MSSERSFWSDSVPLRMFRNFARTKPRRLPGVTCCRSSTRYRSSPNLTSMPFLSRVACIELMVPCRLRDGCRNLRMLAYFPGTPLLDAPSRDVSSPLLPGRHLLFSFPDALRYDRAMTWDPMRDLRALQERLSSHRADSWAPPIDVYETHAAYVITVEVPGLTRDQIDPAV